MTNFFPSRRIVQKPWGIRDFAKAGLIPTPTGSDPIGEVWFEDVASEILVKFLFTSERLSVQVHPDDVQARAMGAVRGKEECWLILAAERGANYGIGFKRTVSADEVREAALDGTIVDLIEWRQARVGDFIYNTPGTVHALGPGLTVLEVQQNSDVTLRLFDYLRGRPSHLEAALAVAQLGPHTDARNTHIDFSRTAILVDGPKFGLAFCKGGVLPAIERAVDVQVITAKDAIEIDGKKIAPFTCMRVDDPDRIVLHAGQSCFLAWGKAPAS